MINENTLSILNNIGFGADIDSLESYIIDFKQARLLSNLAFYEDNYRKLYKILKEIKPNSVAFTDKILLQPLNLESNDYLLTKYPNINTEIAYGVNNVTVNNLKVNLDNEADGASDVFAVTNIEGIDISCVYVLGYLYRIQAIGENNKYLDLTDMLSDKLPDNIDELSKYKVVECRGKLTIFNNQTKMQKYSLNIPCSVMRCIRTKTHLHTLSIVLNDIIIDEDEYDNLPYDNQWDKISFMRDIGLSVPHHALVRNIDRENISQALKELDDYFVDVENTEGIIYRYQGIIVRFNNDIKCNTVGHCMIYNSKQCNSNEIFSSTVKSIRTTSEENCLNQRINIISTKCNDKLTIDFIDIDDIYKLEEYGITVGQKIKFRVVENKAVLYKE